MNDQIALLFYAVVCGALAAFAPSIGGRALRAVTGAVVGIVAASVLPFVKAALGF
jgi:hypothetical protein